MSLLKVENLTLHYGDMQALYGVGLEVAPGTVAALIGPNGAGKTTLLKSVIGGVAKTGGSVRFREAEILGRNAEEIAQLGISIVPEGRRLFPNLSVEENLKIGLAAGRRGPWSLDRVYGHFPILAERARSPATELSGGQQQMAAIGRALMTNPELLRYDELSLGLAPTVVEDIYALLPGIVAEGTALMIVEQDVGRALSNAAAMTCLMEGSVVLQGASGAHGVDQVAQAYFGEPAT